MFKGRASNQQHQLGQSHVTLTAKQLVMEQCCQADRIDPAIEGDSLSFPLIRVFGIGGAGCNIIKTLRDQHSHRPHVGLYTANRVEVDLQADLKFASGIDSSLTSDDQHLISKSVRRADYVILSAGLGGETGTTLIPHFARNAKAHGCKVVAVVGLPFSFEGRRIRIARKAADALIDIADQVITCWCRS